jgi:MFS transporter, DHA2 family, metal-tetracycline-proton antiporter
LRKKKNPCTILQIRVEVFSTESLHLSWGSERISLRRGWDTVMKTDVAVTTANEFDRKKAVPWILFTMFFGVMNETVFNVSTPKIAADYDLTPAGVSWIITIFIITFSIGTVIYGKLADMYSIRSLITVGLVIYAFGAVVGYAFQQWYAAVIIGRAIQGAGVSAIPALIMVVAARYFEAEERSKLFGILTSVSSFAIGVGPVVGGIISAYIN